MSESPDRPDARQVRNETLPTRIGDWLLYPDLGVIRKEQEEKRLGAKPLHVLLLLIQSPDKGLSREDILNRVWGQHYPTDSVVSKAIAELRAALGEKAGEHKYIRTLPKFGYKWVAPIRLLESGVKTESESDADIVNIVATQPSVKNSRYLKFLVAITIVLVGMWLVLRSIFTTQSSPDQNVGVNDIIPITSAPGLEQNPRWSSDGKRIVYSSNNIEGNDWNLSLIELETGQISSFAANSTIHEYGAAFSPDDKTLAYVSIGKRECNIVIQPLLLGEAAPLTPCTRRFMTTIDWSPDGRWIAYTQDETAQNRRIISLIDIHTKDIHKLTTGGSDTSTDFYPRFSADGNHLAFLRGEPLPDHRTELWVVELASGKESLLDSKPAKLGGMTWLDNVRVLYSVEEAGEYVSRITNINSMRTTETNITGLKHYDRSEDNLLAAVQQRQRKNISRLSHDSASKGLFISNYDEFYPSVSPDGQWLSFVSRRSGFDELWIGELGTGIVRQLTRFSGATIRYPDWHPDGRSLLFTTQTSEREIIQQVNIFSGTIYPLERDNFPVTTPRWMPDGKRWVFGCQVDNLWGICLNEDGNTRHLLSHYYRPQPLSNEEIAVVNKDGALFVFNIKTQTVTKRHPSLPNNGRNAWLLTQDTLFYVRVVKGQGEIVSVALNNGNEEVRYTGPMQLADSQISYYPNRDELFFSSLSESADDIVQIQLVLN